MIIGIGTDLCKISRIEAACNKFGARFKNRCFTAHEQAYCDKRGLDKSYRRYAMLFAAKEALSKAIGTGFRHGVAWRDIEIIHLLSGKPTLKLHNKTWQIAQSLMGEGKIAHFHISLTDESGMAQAMVIFESIPQ